MVDHPPHASVVLNIHREAIFLRRTLLSLAEAAEHARSQGIALELVAVLDRTDEETRQVLTSFDLAVYEHVQIVDVDHGSLGPSRNEGITHSSGEFIFTADADDLVSYNYFTDIWRAAHLQGDNSLHFPDIVYCFGDDNFIAHYKGSETIPPKAFVDEQPYISRVCAHRDLFLRIPYADVRLSNGYAYEDWHFNAQAAASGANIRTVAGPILFYRTRTGGLLRTADAISIRQIPATMLFEPAIFLARSKEYNHAQGQSTPSGNESQHFTESLQTKDIIARANAIEPAISLKNYKDCRVHKNYTNTYPLGTAYLDLCEIIQGHDFSDVFLFPFMSRGGAEKYFLYLMEAIYAADPFNDFLVILGEDLDKPQWLDRLPPNAVVVDMAVHCRSLTLDQRCVLALKMVETCSPGTRIHMRQSVFANRFLELYGVVLKDWQSIYYRFPDIERIHDGMVSIAHSPLGLIADHLAHLSKIVCDSMTTIRKDHHRLGVQTHKWHCLPAPVEMPIVPPSEKSNASRRILWASRLDTEKRPSLLPLIATRLRHRISDAFIDVYGGSVFGGFNSLGLARHPNLRYHGPYDGFDSLPLSRFSVFFYTSLHDGIPNAILEAMSHGLAVIAPDVGSISEIVIDGQTGILLPSLTDDRAMAASYVQALDRLLNDPDLLRTLGEGGREFVRKAHSPEAHAKRVADLFGLQPRMFQYA